MYRPSIHAAAALALAAFFVSALPSEAASRRAPAEAIGETHPLAALTGNRFDGAWWVNFPGGNHMIMALTRDGTATAVNGLDKEGSLPFQFSSMKGVWVRSGAREAKVILLRFVLDRDGDTTGIERIRLEVGFGEDFEHLQGTFNLSAAPCERLPAPPQFLFDELPLCPDPTAGDLSNAPPQLQGIPITAKRVRIGE